VPGGDRALFELPNGGRVRGRRVAGIAPGDLADVGIRPERLRLVLAGAVPASGNRLEATVTAVVFQGPAVSVQAMTAWGQPLRVLRHVDDFASGGLPEPGEPVTLEWDVERTLIYQTSGSALVGDGHAC
jgi:hypothetical protein